MSYISVFNILTKVFSKFSFQDPTEQAQIDNFMVQQLDGTVNEWGWCKQKVLVSFPLSLYFVNSELIFINGDISISSLEPMPYLQCHLLFAKLVLA